jgi:cytidine deaminase
MTTDGLVLAARLAAKNAYSPYSGFRVGCAAVFDGCFLTPFRGVNVENASYGLTICAERAAIFSGVSAGVRTLDKLAIACLSRYDIVIPCFQPCGACLQVISEFAAEHTEIVLDGVGVFKLHDFLPRKFTLSVR